MGPECYFERKLFLANDLSRTKGERMRDVHVFVCVLWEIGLSPWTKWQHSHALNRECLRLNATMCADGKCYWQYCDIVTHIKTISSMVLKKLWHSPLCRTHHHPISQHFAVYTLNTHCQWKYNNSNNNAECLYVVTHKHLYRLRSTFMYRFSGQLQWHMRTTSK